MFMEQFTRAGMKRLIITFGFLTWSCLSSAGPSVLLNDVSRPHTPASIILPAHKHLPGSVRQNPCSITTTIQQIMIQYNSVKCYERMYVWKNNNKSLFWLVLFNMVSETEERHRHLWISRLPLPLRIFASFSVFVTVTAGGKSSCLMMRAHSEVVSVWGKGSLLMHWLASSSADAPPHPGWISLNWVHMSHMPNYVCLVLYNQWSNAIFRHLNVRLICFVFIGQR